MFTLITSHCELTHSLGQKTLLTIEIRNLFNTITLYIGTKTVTNHFIPQIKIELKMHMPTPLYQL